MYKLYQCSSWGYHKFHKCSSVSYGKVTKSKGTIVFYGEATKSKALSCFRARLQRAKALSCFTARLQRAKALTCQVFEVTARDFLNLVRTKTGWYTKVQYYCYCGAHPALAPLPAHAVLKMTPYLLMLQTSAGKCCGCCCPWQPTRPCGCWMQWVTLW